MDFTLRTDVDLGFDAAVEAVTAALQEQGFGVLTRIDVRQTLRDKLGVDTEPQVILGACNPQLAHRALQVEPRIGALLPCNVVVRAGGGRTIVEALDPALMATVPETDGLGPIADDAGTRIRAALAAVAGAS
jgi:uncharacterized protein (DUF302 family)